MPNEFTLRNARTDDASAIATLVRDAGLPGDGIETVRFVVAEHDARIVGCAGLEVHGDAGLLRSVAVNATWRRHGVGEALVRAVLDLAATLKLDPVVLLTTTAPEWFPRFGFNVSARDSVPRALLDSGEFSGACPDTATVMRRDSKQGA